WAMVGRLRGGPRAWVPARDRGTLSRARAGPARGADGRRSPGGPAGRLADGQPPPSGRAGPARLARGGAQRACERRAARRGCELRRLPAGSPRKLARAGCAPAASAPRGAAGTRAHAGGAQGLAARALPARARALRVDGGAPGRPLLLAPRPQKAVFAPAL